MDIKKFTKTRKIYTIILLGSLAGTLSISILPIISERVTPDTPDYEEIYYPFGQQGSNVNIPFPVYQNINSMEKRNNDQIRFFVEKTHFIIYGFIAIICLSLLGLVITVLQLCNLKKIFLSRLQISICIILLSLCIFILFNQYKIVEKTWMLDQFNLANMEAFNLPFKYFYFVIIAAICVTLSASANLVNVAVYAIKNKKRKTMSATPIKGSVEKETANFYTLNEIKKQDQIDLRPNIKPIKNLDKPDLQPNKFEPGLRVAEIDKKTTDKDNEIKDKFESWEQTSEFKRKYKPKIKYDELDRIPPAKEKTDDSEEFKIESKNKINKTESLKKVNLFKNKIETADKKEYSNEVKEKGNNIKDNSFEKVLSSAINKKKKEREKKD